MAIKFGPHLSRQPAHRSGLAVQNLPTKFMSQQPETPRVVLESANLSSALLQNCPSPHVLLSLIRWIIRMSIGPQAGELHKHPYIADNSPEGDVDG
jgi:hypothetical protein